AAASPPQGAVSVRRGAGGYGAAGASPGRCPTSTAVSPFDTTIAPLSCTSWSAESTPRNLVSAVTALVTDTPSGRSMVTDEAEAAVTFPRSTVTFSKPVLVRTTRSPCTTRRSGRRRCRRGWAAAGADALGGVVDGVDGLSAA